MAGRIGYGLKMKAKAIAMVADGMKVVDVAEKLKIGTRVIFNWLKNDPELVRQIHDEVRVLAVAERPKNFEALVKIRDGSKNDAARIKAIIALEAQAGVVTEEKGGIRSVVILGQQVNVATMRGSDLDDLIKAASQKCGPEMEKVVDGVLANRTPGKDSEGEHAGAGETPSAAPPASTGQVA